jgi:hypothetical protein
MPNWKKLIASGSDASLNSLNVKGTITANAFSGNFQGSIANNLVSANQLNVTGNGTTSQYLRSDGDGSFTWATPPNTTYSVGDGGLTEINFTSALNTKLAGIAASANNYSLPEATATTRGGIELFSNTDNPTAANDVSSTTGRTYGIQLNSAGQAVVNVPWVDTNTNTTYSAGTGLTLSGTTFSLSSTYDNYVKWQVSDGITNTNVASGDKVTFIGGGATNISYDAASKTFTISSTDTNTDTNTTYSAGAGLTLSGTTFSHTDTSTQTSVNNSGRTYIQDITLDTYGHITGITSATETVVNTDTNTQRTDAEIREVTNNQLVAGDNVTLTADDSGDTIIISSTDTNTTYSVGDGGLTQKNFTTTLFNKLNGIAAGATNVTNNNQLTNGAGYQTAAQVSTAISNVIDSAPDTLNTLNELAAALGDDPNFATTVSTSIGTKLAKASNLSDLADVGTARTNLGLGSLATLSSVNAATITDNSVGAAELNVTGNGTTSQFLRSDGDGTFTWATPTDTNTTYTVGDGGLTQKNFTTTLFNKLNGIAASADNYGSWTISDGVNTEGIGSGATLTIRGAGASTAAYDAASNTLTISSTDTNTDTNTTYSAGNGLSLSGTTFSHSDTSTQTSVNNSGRTYIQDITLDTYGHITGIVSATETVVNTDTNTQRTDAEIREVTYNQLVAGDNVTLTASSLDGETIIISSTDTNTTYSVGDGGLTQKNFTSALKTKLDGIAASANNYSLPEATSTVRGGIELFSDTDQSIAANTVSATAGRTYGIQLNSAGQAVVNVPWSDTNTDTNTTYSAGSGITLSGTTFSHSDTSSQGSVNNSGRTYIQDITLDTYGHITGIVSATETVVNTDTNTITQIGTEGVGLAPGDFTFIGKGATTITQEGGFITISSTDTDTNTTYSVGNGGLTEINFTSALNTKLAGIAASANNYSLPEATATTRGGIELFSNTDQSVAANDVTSTASRTYGIQLNSAGQAVVNVPWVDTNTNTTYSAGTGLTLSGTTFSLTTPITNNNQLTNGAGYQTAAQVNTAIQGVVDSAPDALNTLNELAAALGDDANFAGTVTTALAGKLSTTGKAADSNLLDGLDLHTGRNNEVNKVVRTNASGYAEFGWINTTSGNTTGTITDFFVNTNDGYIRKATPAHIKSQLGLGSAAYVNTSTFDSAGSAAAVNSRIDNEVLPAIPTNNNQLTNGAGYITSYTDTNTTYTAGTGLTLVGTEFRNAAPDQTVSLTGAGATTISGTYPNFTITSTDTNTDTNTTYTAGGGLTLSGTTFSHTDTSTQTSVNNSGRTYIQDITLDTYGHITGITSATETVVNTDTNTVTQIGIGGGPAPAPGDFIFKGEGATTIIQDGSNIYFSSTDTNTDTTYSVGDGGLTQKNFTSALKTKLDGIAASANNYSLPEATSTVRGGIELFSDTDQSVAANDVTSTASRTYGIQLNSAGQAVVNVPWSDTNTDTNTTYSAGSGITLSGTTFSHTDTSSQGSVNNSGRTYIQDITLRYLWTHYRYYLSNRNCS